VTLRPASRRGASRPRAPQAATPTPRATPHSPRPDTRAPSPNTLPRIRSSSLCPPLPRDTGRPDRGIDPAPERPRAPCRRRRPMTRTARPIPTSRRTESVQASSRGRLPATVAPRPDPRQGGRRFEPSQRRSREPERLRLRPVFGVLQPEAFPNVRLGQGLRRRRIDADPDVSFIRRRVEHPDVKRGLAVERFAHIPQCLRKCLAGPACRHLIGLAGGLHLEHASFAGPSSDNCLATTLCPASESQSLR